MSSPLPLKNHTIVFDLDGTLVHTAPDLLNALNRALSISNFKTVPAEAAYGMIGLGAKAMIRAGIAHQNAIADEALVDGLFDIFLEYYEANIAEHSQPYPGCRTALERLGAAGATLAICTNKRQGLADRVLASLSLTEYFAAVVGADSVTHPKPAGEHLTDTIHRAGRPLMNCLMIGDSQTDETAADNAGLPFLFVPFGYGPIGPDRTGERTILNHYDDLSVDMIKAITAA